MTLRLEAAAGTHIGHVRRRNEDSAYVGRQLIAVADGLGGHVAGDIASASVIDTLRLHDDQIDPTTLADVLGAAINTANQGLRHRIETDPDLAGMGTTLVAMLWSGTTAVLANVGDSRAYWLPSTDDGTPPRIIQITEDHTYGNLLADAANVPNLPERITRFLDGRTDGRSPDLTLRELHPGDRYLLCSDGLSAVVPLQLIRATLASTRTPEEAVDRLIDLALTHGGPDNITVIVLDVQDDKT
jgi:protein phosphatase